MIAFRRLIPQSSVDDADNAGVCEITDQSPDALLAKGRVDFIFPADYREGTGLDVTVQNIIRKMAISDALTAENVRQIQSIGHTEVPGQAGLFE